MAEARLAAELRSQIAERVTAVLAPGLFVLLAAVAVANQILAPAQWGRTMIAGIGACACSVVWWLGRTGRVVGAAHTFVAATSGVLLLGMIANGGVHALAYQYTLMLVVVVAAFYGLRPALAFCVFWVVTGCILVWLESHGLLRVAPSLSSWQYVIGTGSALFATLVASVIPVRMLRRALAASEVARLVAEDARQAESLASNALAARETALRESDAFRKRVFESSRMPIVIADADTLRYLDCNPAATDIYRFASREETLGKTPMDVSAPVQYDGTPSAEKARFYVARALADGAVEFNWRHQRPDGEIWDAQVHLMSFESGGHPFLQFTLQDITARRRAESIARDAELRLGAAVDAADLGCYERTVGVGRVEMDARASSIAGIPPGQEHLALEYWIERMHPDDRAAALQLTRRLEDGTLVRGSVEYRYRHPELGWRWHAHAARSLDMSSPEPGRRIVGAVQDITERKQAEEALRESEQRFATAFHFMPVGAGITTIREGRFLQVNKHFAEVFGYTEVELLGRTTTDVGIWADQADRAYVVSQVEKGLPVHAYECRIRRKDGSIGWAAYSGQSVSLHGQECLLSGAVDITERKLAEEAVHQSEARFRVLVENAPEAIVVVRGEDGVFVDANEKACRLFKLSREELLTRTPADLSPPAQPNGQPSGDAAAEKIRRAIDGELLQFEWLHRDALGHDIPCEVHLNRLPSASGILLRGSVIDITERKQAEARLRQQAALLDITQDAVCVLTPDGTVTYWNRAAETIFGWTADEALALGAERTLGLGCEDSLRAGLTQAAERATWSGEMRTLTKSRRPVVTHTRANLVCDALGNRTGYLLVSTDITEQKQLEQQYLRAQRLECLGALASGIAHDLNNVLAPIVMSLDLLTETLRAREDQATLDLLQQSAQRGAGIVRQLLTFARGSEGTYVEVNTQYLLAELRRMIEQTFPRDIRFQISYPQDVWNIVGDATQIHQVLLNLCVNARDALPQGGRLSVVAENADIDAVYTRLNPEARQGRYVRLRVTDSGAGIAPEVLDRIFDPFFTTKGQGQGTGLGLATVQTIVRRHGGIIEVESVVGRGTEFRVYIPAVAGTADAPAAVPDAAGARGRGELVLLIDDEPSIREIARGMLKLGNYDVITAADGNAGLEVLRARGPEIRVVVTDMLMPEMGGVAVLEAIRQLDSGVPLVTMSGLASEHEEATRAAGRPVIFLQKPFTGSDLLRAVATALGRTPKD